MYPCAIPCATPFLYIREAISLALHTTTMQWPIEIEPTVSRGTITLLRMPLSSTELIAATSLLERNSPRTLEHHIFKGTSYGRMESLSLQFAGSWIAVILQLPAAIIRRTIGIVEKPERLTMNPMEPCILAEIYRPILPTEEQLKSYAGRLLGILRNPGGLKRLMEISESECTQVSDVSSETLCPPWHDSLDLADFGYGEIPDVVRRSPSPIRCQTPFPSPGTSGGMVTNGNQTYSSMTLTSLT